MSKTRFLCLTLAGSNTTLEVCQPLSVSLALDTSKLLRQVVLLLHGEPLQFQPQVGNIASAGALWQLLRAALRTISRQTWVPFCWLV
jgi:hypothetical protein